MKKTLLFLILIIIFSIIAKSTPEWLIFRQQIQYPGNSIGGIVVDNNNMKWATIDSLIYKFDGKYWEKLIIPSNILQKKYFYEYLGNIYFENISVLWIEYYDGLIKYDGTNWFKYDTINSKLPNNNVFSMNFDKFGNKWICTKGLVKIKDSLWTIFNKSNTILPTDDIEGVAIDSLNNKWIIAASWGLLKYNDTTWTSYYATDTGFPMDALTNILVDSKNRIWCICYGQGLLMYDNNKWHFYNKDRSSLPENVFESMALDKYDNLWLVGAYGLVKFDGINSTSFNLPSKMGFNQSFIVIDKNGNKFVRCLQDILDYTIQYMGVFNENGIVGVTDVGEPVSQINFQISPNPASNFINLNLPPEYQTQPIKIYSVEGILVYQTSDDLKSSDVSAKIDISGFAPGVYYVKVGDKVLRFVKI